MNILATGSSGFIGSHLVRRLKKNHKVIALVRDVLPSKWLKEALDGVVKVRGDIRNFNFLKRVLVDYEVDSVIHLASQAIVKHAFKDPVNTCDINVMGTVKLLQACRQADVEYVICQSTDKVYGNQKEATVESRLIPTEPYGASKIAMDVIAQSFVETYGMKICITRSCNVFGFDPFNNRIVPNTVKACLENRSPIIFKDCKSERQYIYVEDEVSALTYLMEHQIAQIINIATADILTQEEVVLKILEFFPSLKPKYVEKPKLREIKSQSMIPTLFGWSPKYNFKGGIKLTIEAFRRYSFEDWEWVG